VKIDKIRKKEQGFIINGELAIVFMGWAKKGIAHLKVGVLYRNVITDLYPMKGDEFSFFENSITLRIGLIDKETIHLEFECGSSAQIIEMERSSYSTQKLIDEVLNLQTGIKLNIPKNIFKIIDIKLTLKKKKAPTSWRLNMNIKFQFTFFPFPRLLYSTKENPVLFFKIF
jgi:hypothetical protein